MIYRKKPVEIEAREFTGGPSEAAKIVHWAFLFKNTIKYDFNMDELLISTLEGTMRAQVGDFIIKGVQNEFYPCRADIFRETYEDAS
jgi:hypothetical protein